MKNVRVALLGLRLSVFVVLLVWTLDKLFNPAHGSRIIDSFFGISGVGEVLVVLLGVLEMVLILMFVTGSFKRLSYGAVLVIHGMSTLVTLPVMFVDPFGNLLFFAAFPMLASCFALYRLRDEDTLLTLRVSSMQDAI